MRDGERREVARRRGRARRRARRSRRATRSSSTARSSPPTGSRSTSRSSPARPIRSQGSRATRCSRARSSRRARAGIRATEVGRGGLRGADRAGRAPVHPHALGASRRHRPDPAVRDVGDRADRRAAVREPAARPRRLAPGDRRAPSPARSRWCPRVSCCSRRSRSRVAVVRLARRRVLVQELPAVEGLARVDVLCIDKTGHAHGGRASRVERVERLDETLDPDPVLAALAGRRSGAQRDAPRDRRAVPGPAGDGWSGRPTRVPFSSARKWSAASVRRSAARGCSARPTWCSGERRSASASRGAGGGAASGSCCSRGRDALDGDGCPAELEPVAAVRARRPPPPRRRGRRSRYFAEQDVDGEGADRATTPRRSPRSRRQLGLDGADEPVDARDARPRTTEARRRAREPRRLRPRHPAAEARDGACAPAGAVTPSR